MLLLLLLFPSSVGLTGLEELGDAVVDSALFPMTEVPSVMEALSSSLRHLSIAVESSF